MCVALPGTVISVEKDKALVSFEGNQVSAQTGLVPVKAGDRVLVHAGCILQILNQTEADENKAAFLSAGISGKTAPTDGSVRYTHGSDCKKWHSLAAVGSHPSDYRAGMSGLRDSDGISGPIGGAVHGTGCDGGILRRFIPCAGE